MSSKSSKKASTATPTPTSSGGDKPQVRLAPAQTTISEVSYQIRTSDEFNSTVAASDKTTDFRRSAYSLLRKHEQRIEGGSTMDFSVFAESDDDDDEFGDMTFAGMGSFGMGFGWGGGSFGAEKRQQRKVVDEATLTAMTQEKAFQMFKSLKNLENMHNNVMEQNSIQRQNEEERVKALKEALEAAKSTNLKEEDMDEDDDEDGEDNIDLYQTITTTWVLSQDEYNALSAEDKTAYDAHKAAVQHAVDLQKAQTQESAQEKSKCQENETNLHDLLAVETPVPIISQETITLQRDALRKQFANTEAKLNAKRNAKKENILRQRALNFMKANPLTNGSEYDPDAIYEDFKMRAFMNDEVFEASSEEGESDEDQTIQQKVATFDNNDISPDKLAALLEKNIFASDLDGAVDVSGNGSQGEPKDVQSGPNDINEDDDMPQLDEDDDDMPQLDEDDDDMPSLEGDGDENRDWLHTIATIDESEKTAVQDQKAVKEAQRENLRNEYLSSQEQAKNEGDSKANDPNLMVSGNAENKTPVKNYLTDSLLFDFRQNSIPDGCNIIGAAKFEREADGATFLTLEPGSYLELTHDMGSYHTQRGFVTISMDILIEKLPDHTISLFSTNISKDDKADVSIKRGGLLSISNLPPSTVAIKAEVWQKITIAFDPKLMQSSNRFIAAINNRVALTCNPNIVEVLKVAPQLYLFGSHKAAAMENRIVKVRSVALQAKMLDPENLVIPDFSSMYSKWETELDSHQSHMYESMSLATLYNRPPPAWRHPLLNDILVTHDNSGCDISPHSLYLYSLLMTQTADTQIDMFPSILPPKPVDDDGNVLIDGNYKQKHLTAPDNITFCTSIFDSLATMFMDATAMIKSHPSTNRAMIMTSFVNKVIGFIESLGINDSTIVPLPYCHYVKPLKQSGDGEDENGTYHTGKFMIVIEVTSLTTAAVTLVNTSMDQGVKYQGLSGAGQQNGSALHYKPAVTAFDIPLSHLLNHATWLAITQLLYSQNGRTIESVYYDFLPMLFDRPWDFILYESQQREIEFAKLQLKIDEQISNISSSRSSLVDADDTDGKLYYQQVIKDSQGTIITPKMLKRYADCDYDPLLGTGSDTQLILATTSFVMKRMGVPNPQPLILAIKLRVLDLYFNDLSYVNVMSPSELTTIDMALRSVALSTTHCVDQAYTSHGVQLTHLNKQEGIGAIKKLEETLKNNRVTSNEIKTNSDSLDKLLTVDNAHITSQNAAGEDGDEKLVQTLTIHQDNHMKSVLTSRQLFIIYRGLNRLEREMKSQTIAGFTNTTQPTLLLDDSGYSKQQQYSLFPLADRFVLDDNHQSILDHSNTQGLVGFDSLDFPQGIKSYPELIYTLRKIQSLLTAIRVQRALIKNPNLLARSLLFQMLTQLIPVPISPYSPVRQSVMEKKRLFKLRQIANNQNKLLSQEQTGTGPVLVSTQPQTLYDNLDGDLEWNLENNILLTAEEQEVEDCFYYQRITRSQQVDLLMILSAISQILSIQYLSEISLRHEATTEDQTFERLLRTPNGTKQRLYNTENIRNNYESQVVIGVIFSIMDFIVHKTPSDQRNPLVDVMNQGYGFRLGNYIDATKGCLFKLPEMAICRAKVIEYFSLSSPHYKTYLLDLDGPVMDTSWMTFYQVLQTLIGASQSMLGEEWTQLFNGTIPWLYREVPLIIRIAGQFRIFQTDPVVLSGALRNSFPNWSNLMYNDNQTPIRIGYNNSLVFVIGETELQEIYLYPPKYISHTSPNFVVNQYLYELHLKSPAGQANQKYTPIEVNTEDDILHLKSLPNFNNTLSQQDSEQLLSYLTVPYLRIPLLTSFFATEDRCHAFRSPALRAIFEQTLFEQGDLVPINKINSQPQQVPTVDKELIGTSYGMLFMELVHNPGLIIDNLCKIFRSCLELDVGLHSPNTFIILYVIRILSQVENYVDWLLTFNQHLKDEVLDNGLKIELLDDDNNVIKNATSPQNAQDNNTNDFIAPIQVTSPRYKLYRLHTLPGLSLTSDQYRSLSRAAQQLRATTHGAMLHKLTGWSSQLYLELHLQLKRRQYEYDRAKAHLVDAQQALDKHDMGGDEADSQVVAYNKNMVNATQQFNGNGEPIYDNSLNQKFRVNEFDTFSDLEIKKRLKGTINSDDSRRHDDWGYYGTEEKKLQEKNKQVQEQDQFKLYKFEDNRLRIVNQSKRKRATLPTLFDELGLNGDDDEDYQDGVSKDLDFTHDANSGEIFTTDIQFSCLIHSHLLLILRNSTITPQIVTNMIASMMYLSTHHVFLDGLIKPEHLYEIMHRHRRNFVRVIDNMRQEALNFSMEKILKVSTCIAPIDTTQLVSYLYQQITLDPAASELSNPTLDHLPKDHVLYPTIEKLVQFDRSWQHALSGSLNPLSIDVPPNGVKTVREFGLYPGSRGRYVGLMDSAVMTTQEYINYYRQLPGDIYSNNIECEIDIQSLNITIRNSQMETIPASLQQSPVYQAIWTSSMHGALLESNTKYQLWRVIGTGYNLINYLQHNVEPEVLSGRTYSTTNLTKSEYWLLSILEPFRLQYLSNPFDPVTILLPEDPIPTHADCAVLQVCKKVPVLELRISRSRKTIQAFSYVVYNNRLYTAFNYSSDYYLSFHNPSMSTSGRNEMFQSWNRHETAGFSIPSGPSFTALAITRDVSEVSNLSGGLEVFVPEKLLRGTIPASLLGSYDFWQDTDGNIRGYPRKEVYTSDDTFIANHSDYILFLELLSLNHSDYIGQRGAMFHITKVPVGIIKSRLEMKMLAKAGLNAKKSSLLLKNSSISNNSSIQNNAEGTNNQSNIIIPKSPFDNEDEEDDNVIINNLPHVIADKRDAVGLARGKITPQTSQTTTKYPDNAQNGAKLGENGENDSESSQKTDTKDPHGSKEHNLHQIYELIDILHAPKGSASFQIASVLTRLESCAEILPWKVFFPGHNAISLNGAMIVPHNQIQSTASELAAAPNQYVQLAADLEIEEDVGVEEGEEGVLDVDMYKKRHEVSSKLLPYEIEIPSIKIGFKSQFNNHNEIQLYSIDHNDLYISNLRTEQLTSLMKGIPHGLILQSLNNEVQFLVPTFAAQRIPIAAAPYSTELVINRSCSALLPDLSYILYPVHTSHSFTFLPTLTSALMLCSLRFLSRDYDAVIKLLDSISTDTPYSTTQASIYQSLAQCARDMSVPDAAVAMLRLTLTTQKAVTKQPWHVHRAAALYCGYGYNRFVSATNKLPLHDELSLLRMLLTEEVITETLPLLARPDMHHGPLIACLYNRFSYLSSLLYNLPSFKVMLPPTGLRRTTYFTSWMPRADEFVVWYLNTMKEFKDYDQLLPFTILEPGVNAALVAAQQQQQHENERKARTHPSRSRYGSSPNNPNDSRGGKNNKKEEEAIISYEMITVTSPQSPAQLEDDINLLIPLSVRAKLPNKTRFKGPQSYKCAFSATPKLTTGTVKTILSTYQQCCTLFDTRGFGFLMIYMLLTDDMSFKAKLGGPQLGPKLGAILTKLLRDHTHKSPLNFILRLLVDKPELVNLMPKFSEYKRLAADRERQRLAQQSHNQNKAKVGNNKTASTNNSATKEGDSLVATWSVKSQKSEAITVDIQAFILLVSRMIVRLYVMNPDFVKVDTMVDMNACRLQSAANIIPINLPNINSTIFGTDNDSNTSSSHSSAVNTPRGIHTDSVINRETNQPILTDTDCNFRLSIDYQLLIKDGSKIADFKRLVTDLTNLEAKEQQQYKRATNIKELQVQPITTLEIDEFFVQVTRQDKHLPAISDILPFDISAHPAAQTTISEMMSARLENDVVLYAKQANNTHEQLFKNLSHHTKVTEMLKDPFGTEMNGVLSKLSQLSEMLLGLRGNDINFIAMGQKVVNLVVNNVGLPQEYQELVHKMYPVDYSCFTPARLPPVNPPEIDFEEQDELDDIDVEQNDDNDENNDDEEQDYDNDRPLSLYEDDAEVTARLYFLLSRYSHRETFIGFEYIVGALVSSRSVYDLLKLNPYIPADFVTMVFALTEAVLLRTNRIAQINRTLLEVSDLQTALLKQRSLFTAKQTMDINYDILCTGLLQKSTGLIQSLTARRFYYKKLDHDKLHQLKAILLSDEEVRNAWTNSLDSQRMIVNDMDTMNNNKATKLVKTAKKMAKKDRKASTGLTNPSNKTRIRATTSPNVLITEQIARLVDVVITNQDMNILLHSDKVNNYSKILMEVRGENPDGKLDKSKLQERLGNKVTRLTNQEKALQKQRHLAELRARSKRETKIKQDMVEIEKQLADGDLDDYQYSHKLRGLRSQLRQLRKPTPQVGNPDRQLGNAHHNLPLQLRNGTKIHNIPFSMKKHLTRFMIHDSLSSTLPHPLKAHCPLREKVSFLLMASQERNKTYLKQNWERVQAGQNVEYDKDAAATNSLWDVVYDVPTYTPTSLRQAKQGRYGVSMYAKTGVSLAMLKMIENAIKMVDDNDNPILDANGNQVNRDIVYYDPRYLVFEFTWSLLLRKSQVEMIDDIVTRIHNGESMVKGLIMGAGKTTVIAPLVSLILATSKENQDLTLLSDHSKPVSLNQLSRDKLILSVVPPALLEFSRGIMRSTFSSVIFKRVITFQFERASEPTYDLLQKLKTAAKDRSIVISTPTSLKSVLLKLLETQYSIANPEKCHREPDAERHLHILTEIMALFKRSYCLMDECDVILHALKSELNFPFGEKEELDFSPLRWNFATHVLDAITYHDDKLIPQNYTQSKRARAILTALDNSFHRGFELRFLQKTPHLVLLNEEFYFNEIQPHIADWIILFLDSQHITLRHDIIKAFFTHTTAQLAKHETPQLQLVYHSINAQSPHHVKLLILARDWIRSYLPHVMQKICRVHYGTLSPVDLTLALQNDPFTPETRQFLAVPFTGINSPSPSSEYSHPDIVLALTILSYKRSGLRYSDFVRILDHLRSNMTKELGSYSKRPSNIRFNEWVAGAGGKIGQGAAPQVEPNETLAFVMDQKDVTKGKINNNNNNTLLPQPISKSSSSSLQPPSMGKQTSIISATDDDENNENVLSPLSLKTTPSGEVITSASEEEDNRPEIITLRLLKQTNHKALDSLYNLWKHFSPVIEFYLSTLIFPTYMRHQNTKLSASGVDLGSDLIFARRIGFSGTPSDLLPLDLGQCHYEAGADGNIITTLTSPETMNLLNVAPGWGVESVLDHIAQARAPDGSLKYHCFIDTAALITGISNDKVAEYLLTHGLGDHVDGVVFLNQEDKKMVLLKANQRIVPLEQSGIPVTRRFAFYDQIHTTGIDIAHRAHAKAVVSLGKDMTFRDYAQGCYRMRGIQTHGQTLDVLITPEIASLMNRALSAVEDTPQGNLLLKPLNKILQERKITDLNVIEQCKQLSRVAAFLVINSMTSERTQFCQLSIQNTTNIWKKQAFNSLLSRSTNYFKVSRFPSISQLRAERSKKRTKSFNTTFNRQLFDQHLETLKKGKDRGAYYGAINRFNRITKHNESVARRREKQVQMYHYLDASMSLYSAHFAMQLKTVMEDKMDPRGAIKKTLLELRSYLIECKSEFQRERDELERAADEMGSDSDDSDSDEDEDDMDDIDQDNHIDNVDDDNKSSSDHDGDDEKKDGGDDEKNLPPKKDKNGKKSEAGLSKEEKLLKKQQREKKRTEEKIKKIYKDAPPRDTEFENLMTVFHEDLDLAIPSQLPQFVTFYDSVKKRIDDHQHLIVDSHQTELCLKVLDQLKSTSREIEEYSLNTEMVQTMEDEKVKEEEKDQERQIEIEKAAENFYDRSHEEPTPWPFAILSRPIETDQPQFYHGDEFGVVHLTSGVGELTTTTAVLNGDYLLNNNIDSTINPSNNTTDADNTDNKKDGEATSSSDSDTIQSATDGSDNEQAQTSSNLNPFGRLTIKYPKQFYLSSNWYNQLYTGTARRLKNVVMYLDLIPSIADLAPWEHQNSTRHLTPDQLSVVGEFSHELGLIIKSIILLGLCPRDNTNNSGITGDKYHYIEYDHLSPYHSLVHFLTTPWDQLELSLDNINDLIRVITMKTNIFGTKKASSHGQNEIIAPETGDIDLKSVAVDNIKNGVDMSVGLIDNCQNDNSIDITYLSHHHHQNNNPSSSSTQTQAHSNTSFLNHGNANHSHHNVESEIQLDVGALFGPLLAKRGKNTIKVTDFLTIISSAILYPGEKNRHSVALSLTEAETIRRIAHLRVEENLQKELYYRRKIAILKSKLSHNPKRLQHALSTLQPLVLDNMIIGSKDAAFALRCVPFNGVSFATTAGYTQPSYTQFDSSLQLLRFINNDTYYTDPQIHTLVNLLDGNVSSPIFSTGQFDNTPNNNTNNSTNNLAQYYTSLLAARRRYQSRWIETPVKTVLSTTNRFELMKNTVFGQVIDGFMKGADCLPWDYFTWMDINLDTTITPAEFYQSFLTTLATIWDNYNKNVNNKTDTVKDVALRQAYTNLITHQDIIALYFSVLPVSTVMSDITMADTGDVQKVQTYDLTQQQFSLTFKDFSKLLKANDEELDDDNNSTSVESSTPLTPSTAESMAIKMDEQEADLDHGVFVELLGNINCQGHAHVTIQKLQRINKPIADIIQSAAGAAGSVVGVTSDGNEDGEKIDGNQDVETTPPSSLDSLSTTTTTTTTVDRDEVDRDDRDEDDVADIAEDVHTIDKDDQDDEDDQDEDDDEDDEIDDNTAELLTSLLTAQGEGEGNDLLMTLALIQEAVGTGEGDMLSGEGDAVTIIDNEEDGEDNDHQDVDIDEDDFDEDDDEDDDDESPKDSDDKHVHPNFNAMSVTQRLDYVRKSLNTLRENASKPLVSDNELGMVRLNFTSPELPPGVELVGTGRFVEAKSGNIEDNYWELDPFSGFKITPPPLPEVVLSGVGDWTTVYQSLLMDISFSIPQRTSRANLYTVKVSEDTMGGIMTKLLNSTYAVKKQIYAYERNADINYYLESGDVDEHVDDDTFYGYLNYHENAAAVEKALHVTTIAVDGVTNAVIAPITANDDQIIDDIKEDDQKEDNTALPPYYEPLTSPTHWPLGLTRSLTFHRQLLKQKVELQIEHERLRNVCGLDVLKEPTLVSQLKNRPQTVRTLFQAFKSSKDSILGDANNNALQVVSNALQYHPSLRNFDVNRFADEAFQELRVSLSGYRRDTSSNLSVGFGTTNAMSTSIVATNFNPMVHQFTLFCSGDFFSCQTSARVRSLVWTPKSMSQSYAHGHIETKSMLSAQFFGEMEMIQDEIDAAEKAKQDEIDAATEKAKAAVDGVVENQQQ